MSRPFRLFTCADLIVRSNRRLDQMRKALREETKEEAAGDPEAWKWVAICREAIRREGAWQRKLRAAIRRGAK